MIIRRGYWDQQSIFDCIAKDLITDQQAQELGFCDKCKELRNHCHPLTPVKGQKHTYHKLCTMVYMDLVEPSLKHNYDCVRLVQ